MTVATRYRDVIIILEIRETIGEEWLASLLKNYQMYTGSGPQLLDAGDTVVSLEMRESIVKARLASHLNNRQMYTGSGPPTHLECRFACDS